MKKRRLAAILLSLLSFNALNSSKLSLNLLPTQTCSAEQIIKRPLVICVMGENKEYNNAVASLVLENDTNARLKDITITDFDSMQLYTAKNNSNLKVAVITYDPKVDDFNQIESVFKNKFDCMNIIFHISDEKTFTYEKIKKFYDTFNEAWVGKDVYKTMMYHPISCRYGLWNHLLAKDKHHSPRNMFFAYNEKVLGLKKNKEFLDSLEGYVGRMPDSRSVIAINLNNDTTLCIFESLISEVTNDFSKIRTLQNIQKLENSDELEKTVAKEQQENAKMSSKQIGLICSLAGIGAISTAVAGVLIKKKLSSKPKITKPEVKNKEIKNLKNNKLLT